ncbi:MAG: uncharacterized protein QG622_1422 [Actinomycetota bacterium]|nr:uncharacterized protein [Actinomycetota bacterium]
MSRYPLQRSRFTLQVPDDSSVIWFNSLSGASLRLTADQSELLSRLTGSAATGSDAETGAVPPGDGEELPPDLRDRLELLGFLVEDAEAQHDHEHARYLQARESDDVLFITVAPTLACNLRCSYCFQQDVTRLRLMSDEIRDALIELVRAKMEAGVEGVVMQWYGGEPLLAADFIRHVTGRILQMAGEYGVEYRGEMLTNGLLLQRSGLWKELGDLRIRVLQIPLDGSPETYAVRKEIDVDRAREFYGFLYEHIEEILDLTHSVVIRINVDRENAEEAFQVVDEFARHGVTDRRLDFRLGFLNARRGVIDCIPHDCFEEHEFLDQEDAFREHLHSRGFRVFGRPAPRPWACAAPLRAHLAVDPVGRIGKCVPAIGTTQSVFATLRPGDVAGTLAELEVAGRPYGDVDPFTSPTCGGCAVLPICLGSCPKDVNGDPATCSTREGIEQRIVSFARR